MKTQTIILRFVAAAALAGCGSSATLPVSAGTGPNPVLPPPRESLIPVINVVTAKGWKSGEMPTSAPGTSVTAFAKGLNHPRWVYVLPNGDALIAETNAPDRPEDSKGIRGIFFKYFMRKAGGATPSANRIILLRDSNGDGMPETRTVFLSGLRSPFGMTLVGNDLYVANTNAIVRFPYTVNQTEITVAGTKIVDLPAGSINHHWTKNVIATADGSKLYVAVGSNSNAGENGIDQEESRASIWEVDPVTGAHRVFASGLRNPVGLAWEPSSGALWVAVNERDELGSDLVPDYMTAVKEGVFYGWPYSYYGQHVDTRVEPKRPDLVEKAIPPDYALGPHTASLGLAWSGGTTLPSIFSHGMFVGQHGSWNRKPRSGYKVIFVPFNGSMPGGPPIDVLSGFVRENGDAMGRPVGVAVDKRGALLVVDDIGNTVWRVTASSR
ncbi:MAG TPA: sorbosone dehydrogenase family protein [Gemmatimonadaceae bacterium]|nr:sorbosone dehydrogenase family protein [Gemmatimonadaceae bacterium]